MFDTLSAFIILSGITTILVVLSVTRLANKTLKLAIELVRLNEDVYYNTHLFIENAFILLGDLDLIDHAFSITIMGNKLERKKTTRQKGLSRTASGEEYNIYIEIVPPMYKSKGENKYIYAVILEIMFILIKIDALMKIKAVNETFVNISKLQTLLLHDIKNTTQFIQTLSYNLENIDSPEEEHRMITYLKESSPLMLVKAKKILHALEVKDIYKLSAEKRCRIEDLMKKIFGLYQIPYEINGSAEVSIDEIKLMTVFDNLIKNVYDKSLTDENLRCFAGIHEKGNEIIVTIEDTGHGIDDVNKIFEPFFTTKDGSLGIGLFHVKNELAEINGSISAENTVRGAKFTVRLPAPPPLLPF